MPSRFWEFFEDSDSQLSMTRLLCFLSFFPSTYVVETTGPDHIETVFAIYMTAFAVSYVGGKISEKIRIGGQQLPLTTIQQSGTGDVNVTK